MGENMVCACFLCAQAVFTSDPQSSWCSEKSVSLQLLQNVLNADKSSKRCGVAAKCCLTRGKYMLIEFQQEAALYFKFCSSCVLVQ